MGFLPNQNYTLDSSGPEKTQLGSTLHLPPIAVDAILALGVLTFALQLCVVLYFLFRCWRLDHHIQETVKQNGGNKNELKSASPLKQDLFIQIRHYQQSQSTNLHQHYKPVQSDLLGPSVPWDLVQR